MKILKYILLIILGLIGIYLLLCLAGPKDMNVVKNIEVKSPAAIPFNLTNNLQSTELWNSWTLNDTTVTVEYNDITSGVGSSSAWASQITGEGTQKIVESEKNSRVRSELRFKGWDGTNYAEFNFNQEGDNTNVSYSFEGPPLPFLMRGMALVTGMKKSMHSNYGESLKNIKRLAEERASGLYDGYQMNELDLDEKHFMMHRQEVERENMQQFYATYLGSLFSRVQEAGAEMNGMPCGLYFNVPEDNTGPFDMAAAIPVSEAMSVKGVKSFSIPAKRGIVLDFYGDYNLIGDGQSALDAYMADRGYLLDPPIIEEYVTDPGEEPDPSKWLTKITRYYTSSE